MELKQLTDCISYLPASEFPFSSDVVFIETNESLWIYDVGMGNISLKAINKKIEECKKKVKIVLSHFHPDHIANIPFIKYETLYLSENTKKYVCRGECVKSLLDFNEEPGIRLLELPSSHAKGCLVLCCQEYAFLGDGAFCTVKKGQHVYNANLLKDQIEVMESLPVKYFCLSHEKRFVQEKNEVLRLYKSIYCKRNSKESYINVEEFF